MEKSGIIYKKWVCPSPKAVFLLVHGLGASSNRWKFLADFFLQRGIASYAIDLRGFGETKDLKGHIDSFEVYFNDIQSLYNIIKKENNSKKVFLIGDSMGALISFLLVCLKPQLFDGFVCMCAAFKSKLKFSLVDYLKVFSLMLISPKKQLKMPFDSKICTRDVVCQKEMDEDEREHRFATPKLLLNILLAQAKVKSLQDKITIPTLFLIAGEFDILTDPEEVKKVFASLKMPDKALIQYPDMYHSLPIDLGREKVFEDVFQWVHKKI